MVVLRSLRRILELKRIIVLIGLIKISQKGVAACPDCQIPNFRNYFLKKISFFIVFNMLLSIEQ